MPPRRKSRRLNNTTEDVPVRFVPDPVEIPPQLAAEVVPQPIQQDALVSAVVAAVRNTLQSSTTQHPNHHVEAAVNAEVEEIAQGSSGSDEVLPTSPLFHSIAVPLGSRISANIKSKIWAEEFIDFGSLLDPSPNPDKYSLSFTAPSNRALPRTPQFTFEPVKTPKKVTSISDWVSAFHTFVAIYFEKFPKETPKLMKFCETVRDIAARGGDWSYYDEQFRYLRQLGPRQYPWDIVHWELWHRAVTFRPKQGTFQSDRANSKFKGKANMLKGTCWTFNMGRSCSGCRYEHKCSKCGGKHPGTQCQSATFGQQANSDRALSPQSYPKQPASHARKNTHS